MYAPTPPDEREKCIYIHQGRALFYTLAVFSLIPLLISMLVFSWMTGAHFYLVYVALLSSYVIASYSVGIFSKSFNYADYWFAVKDGRAKPTVDIYLPTCGEEISLLRNSYAYIAAMRRWEGVRVYVLDDAKRKEVEVIAHAHGFKYFTRTDNSLKKAGNLRAAFKRTHGEFILVLDADFAPRSDMLEELVQVIQDPSVAIVQTPQYFAAEKEPNWLAHGSAWIQELFYRMIQVNRNAFNASVCVGTCALYRRKALEPFGGTAEIGYSEDLHTGFNVVNAGWKISYIPINYAKGICPDKLKNFFSQQYRWCMGSFSLLTNRAFWNSNLSFVQKACYSIGMVFYVVSAVGLFFNLIPTILMSFFYAEHYTWLTVFWLFPSFLFSTAGIAFWSRASWRPGVMVVRELSYWAYLFAILDKCTGNLMEWIPTGANVKVSKWKMFSACFLSYVFTAYGLLFYGFYSALQTTTLVNLMPTIVLTSVTLAVRLFLATQIIKEKLSG